MSTPIGKITGTHGVKGDLVLEHQLSGSFDTKQWDALMIELLPNSQIPFFIERIRTQTPTSLLVKFEEIQTPEAATEVLQKDVFLSPNVKRAPNVIKKKADSFIGFTLFDKEKEVGVIENILNPASNPLFIIHEGQENELLIPANEELILEVQQEAKIIRLEIPEGLI